MKLKAGQERLNNVFGAPADHFDARDRWRTGHSVSRIPVVATCRRATAGHFPLTNAPAPTTLTVGNAEAAAVKLGMNWTMFVSPGLVQLGRDDLGFTKALLVGADGHVMDLIEK
ncbi:MAG TPA: hypothetical protein VLQ90_15475 [Pyrinomonadaceae bacterium]|nr:hypothetical protein [Pyrinomonadaceae bacterium]